MIRDREDDLDLEDENAQYETSGSNGVLRPMQVADSAVRTHEDVQEPVVPRTLSAKGDNYRAIRKRHSLRRQADRSFH